jgi:hypothetical protein
VILQYPAKFPALFCKRRHHHHHRNQRIIALTACIEEIIPSEVFDAVAYNRITNDQHTPFLVFILVLTYNILTIDKVFETIPPKTT